MSNKIEVVNETKRANNRLKPIGEVCGKIHRDPGWDQASKQFELAFKRLDRELTQDDEHGKALREALTVFQQVYEAGEPLGKPCEGVYIAVRRVQSHRWERVAMQYGSVRHVTLLCLESYGDR